MHRALRVTDTGTEILAPAEWGNDTNFVGDDTGSKLYAFPGGELLQTFGPTPDYVSEFTTDAGQKTWSNPAANDFSTTTEERKQQRRGRPQKPTEKTPCEVPFEIIMAARKAISRDRKGESGRNKARERTRYIVGRDRRLPGSAVPLFDLLLDELRWKEGRCCHSNNWLANALRLDRSTIARDLKALKDAGHVLRRR